MFKSLAWIVAVIFLLCSASSKYKQKHLAHLQNPQITWFLLWCSYTQVFLSCQNLGNDTKINSIVFTLPLVITAITSSLYLLPHRQKEI